MHTLVYSPLAKQDLRDIAQYIAKDNKTAVRIERVVHGARDLFQLHIV